MGVVLQGVAKQAAHLHNNLAALQPAQTAASAVGRVA